MFPATPHGPMLPLLAVTAPRRQPQRSGPPHPGVPPSAVRTLSMLGVLTPKHFAAARLAILRIWAHGAPWPEADRLCIALAACTDAHHETSSLATSLLKQLSSAALASAAVPGELARCLLGTHIPEQIQAGDSFIPTRPWAQMLQAWGAGASLQSMSPPPPTPAPAGGAQAQTLAAGVPAPAVMAAAEAVSPSPVQSRAAALGLASRCRMAVHQPWLGALTAACLNELGALKPPSQDPPEEGVWTLDLQRSSNMSLPIEAARILTQLLRNAQASDVAPCAAGILSAALAILAPAAGGTSAADSPEVDGQDPPSGAASPGQRLAQGHARAASALAATHGTSDTVREQMYSVLAVLSSKAPRQVAAGFDRASVAAGQKPTGSVQDALRLPVFLLACLEHETPALRVSVTEALSGVGAMLRNASPELSLPLNALLVQYATGSNPRARRVAVDWATSVFAFSDVRARFVCCALAADTARDIASSARHGLNPFGKAGVVMGTDVESAAAAAAGGVDSAHLTTAHAASSVVQVALRAWCASVPEVVSADHSDDEDADLYGEDAGVVHDAKSAQLGTVHLTAGASLAATPESPFHITAPLYPAVESLVAFLTSDVNDTIMGGLGLLSTSAAAAVGPASGAHLRSAVAAAAQQRQQTAAGGTAGDGSLADALLSDASSPGSQPGEAKRARTDNDTDSAGLNQRERSVQALSGSVLALMSPAAVGTGLRFVLTCLHASAITAGQDVVSFTASLGAHAGDDEDDSTLARLSQCVDWALSTDPAAVGADAAVAAGMAALVALLTSAPAVFAPRYAAAAPLRWLLGFLGHPDAMVRAGAAQAVGVVALALPVLPGMPSPLGDTALLSTGSSSLLGVLSQLVLVISAQRDASATAKADQHAGCMAAAALAVALAQGAVHTRRISAEAAAVLAPVLGSATLALVAMLESNQPAAVAGATQGLAVIARQGGLPLPLAANSVDPDAASQASVVIALGKLLQGGGVGGGNSADMEAALKTRSARGAAADAEEDFVEPQRNSSSVSSLAQAAAVALGAIAGSLGGGRTGASPPSAGHKRLRLTALDTLMSVSSHASPGLVLTVGAALGEACFGETANTGNAAAGSMLNTRAAAPYQGSDSGGMPGNSTVLPSENSAEVAHVVTRVYDRMVLRGGSASRVGGCTWLLSLLTAATHTDALQPHLLTLHSAFLRVLGDKDGLARSVGSKGLALVYEAASAAQLEEGGVGGEEAPPSALQASMVQALLDTLSGTRSRIGASAAATESSAAAASAATTTGAAADTAGEGGSQSPGGAQEGGALALSAGGDASFKALCAVANDAGQPDLVYRFLALAGQHGRVHARGAAGAGIEALLYTSARRALMPHLRAVLPTIFRFCFDPLPSVRGPMRRLWGLLGGGTAEQLAEHAPRLLHECLRGARQAAWREREGAYAALGDLLAGGRRAVKNALLAQGKGKAEQAGTASSRDDGAAPLMVDVWHGVLQGMDDVHEDVRGAAAAAQRALASLTLAMTGATEDSSFGGEAAAQRQAAARTSQALTADAGEVAPPAAATAEASSSNSDSNTAQQEVLQAVLTFLLESPWGVANGAKEPRTAALLFVRRLVAAAGANVRPFVAFLLSAALDGVAQMESSDLSYLQSHANAAGGTDLGVRLPSADVMERVRIAAVTSSPLWSVVETCMTQLQRMSAAELVAADDHGRSLLSQVADVVQARVAQNTSLLTRAATLRVLTSASNTLPPAALETEAQRLLLAVQQCLHEPRASMQGLLASAGAALFIVVPLGAAQAYIVTALRMASDTDPAARAAAGGAVRSITVSGTRSRERLDRYLKLVVPVAFIAQHDPDARVAAAWSDTWGAICTSVSATVGLYFEDIMAAAARRLGSPAWAVREQAGAAVLAALAAVAPPVKNTSNVFLPAWQGLGKLPAPKDAKQPADCVGLQSVDVAAAAASGACGPAWLRAAAIAAGVTTASELQVDDPSVAAAGTGSVGGPPSAKGTTSPTAPSAVPASGGLFGQAAASPPVASGLFGQTPAAAPLASSLFGGGAVAVRSPVPTGLFGVGGTAQPNKAAAAAPQTPDKTQTHGALAQLPALVAALHAASGHSSAAAGALLARAAKGGPGHGHDGTAGLLDTIPQLTALSLQAEQLVFEQAASTAADDSSTDAAQDSAETRQAMEQCVEAVCAAAPAGAAPLLRVLLQACLGRAWTGKHTVLRAAVMCCLHVLPAEERSAAAVTALVRLVAGQAARSSAEWRYTACSLQCLALLCLNMGAIISQEGMCAVLQCVHDVFREGVVDAAGAQGGRPDAAAEWLKQLHQACDDGQCTLRAQLAVSEAEAADEGGVARLGGGGQDSRVGQVRLASRNKAEQRASVTGACMYVLSSAVGCGSCPSGVLPTICGLAQATAAGSITQSGTLPSACLAALNHGLCTAAARADMSADALQQMLGAASAVLRRGDSAQPKLSRPAALAVFQAVCRGALHSIMQGGASSVTPGRVQQWLASGPCSAARGELAALLGSTSGAAQDPVVRQTLQFAADLLSHA